MTAVGTRRAKAFRLLTTLLFILLTGGGILMFEACTTIGMAPRWETSSPQPASRHFRNGRFVNELPPRDDMMEAVRKAVRGAPNREPDVAIETAHPVREDFVASPDELRLTWFGHSSVLVEISGMRLLTDPVWGLRASPSRFFGPKRFFDPPMPLDEMPDLDAVLISHDHYDHLDHGTVVRLAERGVLFIVPLGVGTRLTSWGIAREQIVELDWWGEHVIGNLTVVCTPARHFSGRGLRDRNRTLWSGWAIISPDKRVFYSGDTGMSPHFSEIGRRLGPFDVTMMETGAYDSAWADVHMGPEQAISAHRAVGGRLFLPLHWGTFNLALHSWTEPVERAMVEADRLDVEIVTPRPGERIDTARPPTPAKWWPEIPWQSADEAPIISSGLTTTIPALAR